MHWHRKLKEEPDRRGIVRLHARPAFLIVYPLHTVQERLRWKRFRNKVIGI